MRIGIDFDNTIICYDKVFVAAARQRGLVPCEWTGLKTDVRDYLRSKPGGELAWQGLQGWVYGKGIAAAELFPGVLDFLEACRLKSASVYVVSHKTKFGHQNPDHTDLRAAARGWMQTMGLVGTGRSALRPADVFFEETLKAKVERLADLQLDVFIDDLADVFEQPHFPRHIRGILFAALGAKHPGHCKPLPTWMDIRREVFAA